MANPQQVLDGDWWALFSYNSNTGELLRKQSAGCAGAGDVAGSLHRTNGYVVVRYLGRDYGAHRIIWEMHNGAIPDGRYIDHIDRNKSNNRLENLRLVTHKQNMQNKGKQRRNRSGYNGVSWDANSQSWRGQYVDAAGTRRAKMHPTAESAAEWVRSKQIELGYMHNHGDSGDV